MKIVLIPTNFSTASLETIKNALTFLQNIGTNYQILLLNTYLVPPVNSGQFIARHDELKKKSLEQLEELRQVVEGIKTSEKITVGILSHMGTLENVINHLVEDRQVDCVAIGAKNNRVPVLHNIQCPVLLMPPPVVGG